MHCEPRALHDELVARFGRMAFADFQEGAIGPGWHTRAKASLLREIARKEAICAHLLDREAWDLFMVVFGESDTVAHHFWMFHDPRSPRFRPGMEDALAEVYVRLDAAVGTLAARGDTVCVVSDHGFGGASDRVLYLNRFLEQAGWLTTRGARTGRIGEAARRAVTRLPLERVIRRVPPRILGRIDSAARYADIDFPRTRAWSDEQNYATTIHLNVRGRDPHGTVDDVDAAAAALTRLLLAWEIEGRRVVSQVWRREAIAHGPAVEDAPDLILDLALVDGYSPTLLPSVRAAPGQTWRRLDPAEHMGGKGLGMNGAHRPEGVWILSGRGVRAVEGPADIVDLAPTLLHLLGEPVPAHVDGRVLSEALLDAGIPTITPVDPVASAPRRLTPREAAAVARRLEALGYR
jgi:predicted AlkP superfamily phosphohydrolase/phosphomutase